MLERTAEIIKQKIFHQAKGYGNGCSMEINEPFQRTTVEILPIAGTEWEAGTKLNYTNTL